mgnify:CR=1 FL=1
MFLMCTALRPFLLYHTLSRLTLVLSFVSSVFPLLSGRGTPAHYQSLAVGLLFAKSSSPCRGESNVFEYVFVSSTSR